MLRKPPNLILTHEGQCWSVPIEVSQFITSACCDAKVVQAYELATDSFPIICGKCTQELAAPHAEDVCDSGAL